MKQSHAEAVVKKCNRWEGLTLEKFIEDRILRKESTWEQRESVNSPSPREEESACVELTTVLILHPLYCCRVR